MDILLVDNNEGCFVKPLIKRRIRYRDMRRKMQGCVIREMFLFLNSVFL